jgi:hypothetical protein
MERSVVLPILRARSAISSVIAKILFRLLIQEEMVVTKVTPHHVPVKVLCL